MAEASTRVHGGLPEAVTQPPSAAASDDEWAHAEELSSSPVRQPLRSRHPTTMNRYSDVGGPASSSISPEVPRSRAPGSADPLNDLFHQIRNITIDSSRYTTLNSTHSRNVLHNVLLNVRRYEQFAAIAARMLDLSVSAVDPAVKLQLCDIQNSIHNIQKTHVQLIDACLEQLRLDEA